MIGVILAILAGLGLLFGLWGALGQFGITAGTGMGEMFSKIGEGVRQALLLFVDKMFLFFAGILPVATMIVIFYIATKKERVDIIVFGAVYGILMYYIVLTSGLVEYVTKIFYSAFMFYNASWLDMFRPVKEFFVGVGFFIIGMFNRIIDNVTKTWDRLRKGLSWIKNRFKKKRRKRK